MASQSTQSSTLPRISLPLVKFSYATVAEGISAPIPWKHISSSNDLRAILDVVDIHGPAGAIEKRQLLRVLQGLDVLEDIDLDILANEAHRTAINAQSTSSHPTSPTITVIAKLPCIAIRYPLAGRRVRFADAEAFYEMMKRLSKAGVPVIDAEASSAQSTTLPYQQNQSIAAFPQIPPLPNFHHRPATATGYDCVACAHPIQSTTSVGDSCYRPATSGMPSMYRQHVPVDNTLPFDERPEVGHFTVPVTATRELRAAFDTPESASWNAQATNQVHDSYASQLPYSSAPLTPIPDGDMPPRRDFSFARNSKTNETITSATQPIPLHQFSPVETQLGSVPDSLLNPATHNVVIEQPTSKSQKRPTDKSVKEPAPKKARAPTTRKKAEPKGRKQSRSVPTVEEILRETIAQRDADTSEQTAMDANVCIDQVQRLSRQPIESDNPNAARRAGTAELDNETEHSCSARPQAKSSAIRQHSAKINAATTAIPNASQAQNAEPTQPSGDSNEVDSIACMDLCPKTVNNPILSAAFTQPIRVDGSMSGKEKSDNDLSMDTRQAIETWICQQLRDDEFVGICKMVDSVWARAFARF